MTDYVYAVIENDKVGNIIISDQENAEEVLKMLLPDAQEVIFSNENTGIPYIDGDFFEGKFRIPKPYQSWVWDSEQSSWVAPIPYPEDNKVYFWNEEEGYWESYIPEQPYPSWTWNEDKWAWIPPQLMPTEGGPYIWDEDTLSWIPIEY